MADDVGTGPEGDLTLQTTTTVTMRGRRRALWGVLAVVAVAAGALAVTAGQDDARGGPPQLPIALGAAAGAERAAGMSAPAADMRMAWITYLAGDDLPALGGDAAAYKVTGAVDEGRVRALADAVGLSGDPVDEGGLWHLRTDDGVLEVYEDGGGSWWYSAQSFVEPGTSSGGGSSGSPGCEPGPAVDCGVVDPDVGVPTTTALEAAPPATIPGTAPTTTVVDGACAVGDGPACSDGTACRTYTAVDGSTVEECAASGSGSCDPNQCVDPAASTCPLGAEVCTLPADPCPPNAECVRPDPIVPAPPADLPSEGDARQIALDLLAETGVDVEGAKVTVDGPYDAWYVSVEPVLDGRPVSGWMSSVNVGSKGAITSASGTLSASERLGDYPVLDTRAAIDRLNEQQGDWFAYAPGVAEDAVGAQEGMTECKVEPDFAESCSFTGTGVACPDVAVASGEADGDVVEVCPVPLPEPQPTEVTLHEAEQILVLLPSFDGSGDSYLVPGYRFTGDDGHVTEVAAIADESLMPAPDTTEVPLPAPQTTGCADVLVEDDGSGTTHTIPPCAGEVPPSQPDLVHLGEGEEPQVGVPYYVDVNSHCGWFVLGSRWWATDAPTPLDWATPTEGGTFTLSTPDAGTFVGDAMATKSADFTARGPAAELPLCR